MTKSPRTEGVAEQPLLFLEPALAIPSNVTDLFASLSDEEVLDLYLDDPEDACSAIKAFGSIAAASAAKPAEILRRAKVSGETCRKLKLVRELSVRIAREDLQHRPPITSWDLLRDYLRIRLAHEPRELFMVLFLDNKNHLIADEIMGVGTIDHAPVYPREVYRRCFELDAKSIIIAHNHPAGPANPSRADIDVTSRIVKAGKELDIAVHDHVIVGSIETYSFKANCLM